MPKRTTIKPEKIKAVENLKNLIEKYPVVGIMNLHKLPAFALQKIKKELHGKAVIKIDRKNIIVRALEKTEKKQLLENICLQPGLILTEINPFKLCQFLKKNKSSATAKAGDVPERDIEVKAGPTDLMPGPAISTLTKVGIPAKVESGKIAIMKDKVVCKVGEKVSQDLASALQLLKVEPIEIGLELIAAYENGMIYKKNDLEFDELKFFSDIILAYQNAVNLSINSEYPTKETIGFMIVKAFLNAKSLDVETKLGI